MAEGIYNRYKLAAALGQDDWDLGDFRALLLTTGGFVATHATLAAVIAGGAVEAAHASYGRQALTSEAAALDAGIAELTCATINFGALTGVTPVAMVIYRHVDGTNANDLPVSYHDTGFGAASNGAGYTVTISANGLIRIT